MDTAIDRAGRIEVRGIDVVPLDERHGNPRELFWIWLGANVSYLYFTLGGFVLLLGLSLWQSIGVIVVGNLFWLGVGALAISGPAAGTPSVIVSRAMLGIRGNRPLGAGIGWLIAVCYEFINLVIGALAAFALADRLGLATSVPVKAVILLVIAVVTFAISIFGHATIARLSPWFALVLGVVMTLLAVFVLSHTDFAFVQPRDAAAPDTFVAITLGVALIAAIPLSWANGADYSRYLPPSVSSARVMLWTALGGFLPCVVLAILGVFAGTAIDMNDAQTNLASIVPSWFYPLFLFVIVFSSITNNVLTAYSSGLCLQALGIRLSRAWTVFIDGLVSVGLASYVIFVSDFTSGLSAVLEVSVAVLAPYMAIYAADIVLRRNAYDGVELHVESPGGRHWQTRGWNLAGALAYALGIVASLLVLNTTVFQGPLSVVLGGSDWSAFAGPVVSIAVYALLWRGVVRRENAATPVHGDDVLVGTPVGETV